MTENTIYNRRSIRKFKPDMISMELIEKVIDAGRVAPSGKNRQPWKCIVLGGEHKREFLSCMEKGIAREENVIARLPKSQFGIPDAKNTLRVMREAPVIIVVLNTNGKSPFTELDVDERFTEMCDNLSLGAFIENMILQAEELGLGTLWIGNTCFAYEELTDYLDTEYQLTGAVALGYANEKPKQRPRKKLEEIVEYRM